MYLKNNSTYVDYIHNPSSFVKEGTTEIVEDL